MKTYQRLMVSGLAAAMALAINNGASAQTSTSGTGGTNAAGGQSSGDAGAQGSTGAQSSPSTLDPAPAGSASDSSSGTGSAAGPGTGSSAGSGSGSGLGTAAGANTASGFSAMGSGYAADEGRYSLMPYTTNGYIGLNLGASDYQGGCGNVGSCDNADLAGKAYVGGMFNPFLGLEAAYLHMGNADRAGGQTRAHGVNLSLVGRVPLGTEAVSAFLKGGATYGRTRTTAAPGSGVASGDENGFGPSFGGGLALDLARNWTVVAEWERHRFKFAGDRRDWVDATTLGVKYRF